MSSKHNILYLSHGGGPLPLLGDEGHGEMVDVLKSIVAKINKPSAIVVVSAHWEELRPTVTTGANPSLIYDYYGFPEESYAITYPCPGEPGLAGQIHGLIEGAGIFSRMDDQRGFDHGLFVPLKIMYPDADIPCVQLSLDHSLDPAAHMALGRALRELEYENILIIGSGFSFHNLQAFFTPPTGESNAMNEDFEAWLLQTCSSPELDEADRTQRLIQWETAPYARYCHPREEHLLPLHVCYGVAQGRCTETFELHIMNRKSSMYLWTT
jgi:aromatic ring-opening dioxygenase catalytic subunit (LigB family)